MKINKRRLLADGITDDEIQRFSVRFWAAVRENRFDNTAVLFFAPRASDCYFVCKSEAEILHDIRPDCCYQEIPNLAELLNL